MTWAVHQPDATELAVRSMSEDKRRKVREDLMASVQAEEARDIGQAFFVSSHDGPPQLPDHALHGLAGEVVNLLDTYTEAHKAGVLLSLMAGFGNIVGGGPHVYRGDVQPARLNVVIVGRSAFARKGTAWSTVKPILRKVAPEWWENCMVTGGIQSGEAIIATVSSSDDDDESEHVPGAGAPGKDTRLFLMEPEFARLLQRTTGDGSTLSAVLRQAWESDELTCITKGQRLHAKNVHASVCGHITEEELQKTLSSVEQTNGFANRFIFIYVDYSKQLPQGGRVPGELIDPLIRRLRQAVTAAKGVGELSFTDDAAALWAELYSACFERGEGAKGMLGSVLSRGPQQILRLAVTYALLDCASVIDVEHLQAAQAVWCYSEASAALVFAKSTGDPNADKLAFALERVYPRGMNGTQLSELFGRHLKADGIARVRLMLEQDGRAVSRKEESTGGRPALVTFWVPPGANKQTKGGMN